VATRNGGRCTSPSRVEFSSSITSPSEATGKTFTPSTTAASGAFTAGKIRLAIPRVRASTAIDRIPGTGRSPPSRPSSPTSRKRRQIRRLQRPIRAQDADGNGQIEARALLLDIRRSQIDGDVGRRNQVSGVLHRRPHAVAALAHRRIRQTDGVKMVFFGNGSAEVYLDIDEVGIDAVDGCTEHFS
jgi:hypothetical protein